MRFSQRIGVVDVRSSLQVRSLDVQTRNRLWNVMYEIFPTDVRGWTMYTWVWDFFRWVWKSYFKQPIEVLDNNSTYALSLTRKAFLEGEWYEPFDFIEFVLTWSEFPTRERFKKQINLILAEELVGFRLIDDQFVEITDDAQIRSIEEALALCNSNRFSPAQTHLSEALKLLSDRQNPDYRNSIKESISAVEAVAKILAEAPKDSLRDALNLLQAKRPLHGSLRQALLSLYGYTSDADGIRHALMEAQTLDSADAKFMLITCSAFVSYFIEKAGESENLTGG